KLLIVLVKIPLIVFKLAVSYRMVYDSCGLCVNERDTQIKLRQILETSRRYSSLNFFYLLHCQSYRASRGIVSVTSRHWHITSAVIVFHFLVIVVSDFFYAEKRSRPVAHSYQDLRPVI